MRTLLAALVLLLAAGRTAAHPPAISGMEIFFGGLPGPEGLAFANDGALVIGSAVGTVRRLGRDGNVTILAELGEPLAGVAVLRDGRVLVASFSGNRVWSIDKQGNASVLASGIPGANYIAQTRRGQIFVSASSNGTIVDIASGTPVVRASGLNFPNGLALGRGKYLYVAETGGSRVSRLPIGNDGTLGTAEVFASGLALVDGIALDREGNLLAVGNDRLYGVTKSGTVSTLSTDPLLNWPASVAFGRGRGFSKRHAFLTNFGLPLGSGMEVVRVVYNHRGGPVVR
jgi:hypothetical protein